MAQQHHRITGGRAAIIITAVILAVALAVGLAVAVWGPRGAADATDTPDTAGGDTGTVAFPAFSFDDTAVTEDEYRQAFDDQIAAAKHYFRQQHDVTLGSDAEAWNRSYDGETPAAWLADQIVDTLASQHAVYRIAADAGLVDDDSYAGIVARMDALNAANAARKADGQVVYGRLSYDIDAYIDYERTLLKNSYTDDESNPGMTLSDDEVQRYYDEHDWSVADVDGKAPLDTVISNVKAQMRAERYADIILQQANALTRTGLDRDALAAYTLALLR